MNIKGITYNIAKIKGAKSLKSESSSKDRNSGGNFYQKTNYDKEKTKLTEEEVAEAVELIKKFSGIIENGFTVHIDNKNNKSFVCVMDAEGSLIRRIAEKDLWPLVQKYNEQSSKGGLLNKSL